MNSLRLGLLALSISLAGCVVAQRIDSATDCNGICDKYASCFDKGYDTSACASRCRDGASKDGDFRRKADKCNECISSRSCVSATFSCVTECVSVVP